ncbi:hypothetical protein [Salinarimonas rosea]|uniref:hypothetical protein n=1 Tax=Salinarimonas rosea TaxID=552063 RepID=UPI0004120E26|nr:hypothetical protein [Salinarimonas rosea]
MQAIKTLTGRLKGFGAVPFVAALALILAPTTGMVYGAALATAIVLGGITLLIFGKSTFVPEKSDPWLLMAVGIATIAVPWIFGFGYLASVDVAIHTLAGVAIAGAALYQLARARHEEDAEQGPDGAGQPT